MEAWAMILAFVAVILSIYYYLIKDFNYFKKHGLPYIEPWPILGNMLPTFFRQKTLADTIINTYNLNPKAKYVGFFDTNNPILMIRDPELIKIIAVKKFDNFPDHKSFVDDVQDPIFGKALFSLRGDRWRETRTMLSPAFTLSKMKGMFKLMNECGADFTDYLSKMPKDKKTIEMKDVFARYTNDVIATCAFGISINSMRDPKNEFYVLGREATNFDSIKTLKFFMICFFPTITKLLKINIVPNTVVNFFKNVVEEVINIRDRDKIVRSDMIQLMMEARNKRIEMGQDLPLMDIVAQAFIFFFGGFDSVSTAMCFTCHEIGVNPDIQQRLQREIDDVIEKTNGNPTYEVINAMEYLDAVISESLRRYPIVVFIDRLCAESYELPPSLPGGKPFLLKKNMNVWFPIYALHHDPKYFEDPYKFDPERFIKRGKEINNSGVYLPFGLGPRICIGNRFALLEIKVLIIHLLARFNLNPSSKTQNPLKLSKKGMSMTAENGFWMELVDRKDVHPVLKSFVPNNIANDNINTDVSINGVNNGHAVKTWAVLLALVAVILSIYYYVFKDLSYFKRIGLPYLEPWPIVGNMGPAIFRQKSLIDITLEVYNLNPEAKYVGFFDISKPVFFIRDPELIKLIAVKSFDNFPDHRGFVDEVQDPLFGKNLFSLKGNRWRETRTMLSPAFTLSKLKGMFKLMNDCGADFTDYLSKMPKDKKTIEMKDVFARYTNDVIATCAFGISINSMRDRDNDFYVLGKQATSFEGIQSLKFFLIRSFPTISKFFNIKMISDKIGNFFQNVVQEVIDTRDRNKIVRSDMIQLMMEARNKRIEMGQDLPLIDIVAQAFIFFFGGFDTVSTAMCFTCHEIGVNPDIQQRLQREIDDVIEKTNGNPTYDVVQNMEYLDAVINESLRRYPIALFLDRMCIEDFELPPSLPGMKPLLIKKGTNVWFPVGGFHLDSKYFEDPYKFDPERFIKRGKEINNSGVYLPFGLGPRMCIGNRFALLEMKVLIFNLLARCNLKPSSKTQNPIRFSKSKINLSAEKGFWMDLEERNDVHPALKNFGSNNSSDDTVKTNGVSNGVANGHADTMETWTIISALVAVVLSIYYYIFKDTDHFKKIGIPYLEPWPIFGNMGHAIFRLKSMVDIIVDVYNLNPKAKYVGFFDMSKPVFFIRDPELIKTIAVKSFDNFPDHRGFVDEVQDPLFGKNLFSLKGNRWRETRTMLSPAFTLSKLKGMFKLMNECGADFTDYLSKMSKDKKTIDMRDVFTRYTNDVIATCAFGINMNSMKDPKNEFYVLGRDATNFDGIKSLRFLLIRNFPTITKFFNVKLIPGKIGKFFKDVVQEVIDTRDRNKIVRSDMIQLMMEARNKRAEMGQELPMTDIVAQAFIFFLAGFDTVSTGMCFTCHEIGVNPDIQQRLQREIDDVIEKTNGNPTYDVINSMQYLDAVLSESLRRYPIALFLDRVSIEDFELPPSLPGMKPLLIKKGTNILFPVSALHLDPKYFDNPYKFDPERFLKNGKEINNSGFYLPFGLGPRMCIGNRFALLEIKVLIFNLLARCNLKPSSKTQNPIRFSKRGINLSAEKGFWMDLEERNDVHPALKNFGSNNSSDDTVKTNGVSNGVTNGHADGNVGDNFSLVSSGTEHLLLCLQGHELLQKKIGIPYLEPWPIVGNTSPVIFCQKTIGDTRAMILAIETAILSIYNYIINDLSYFKKIDSPCLEPWLIFTSMEFWFSVHRLHHDPKYFLNPYKFDPERFNYFGTYSYFGLGLRIFVDNNFALFQIEVLISHSLARYNLDLSYFNKNWFTMISKHVQHWAIWFQHSYDLNYFKKNGLPHLKAWPILGSMGLAFLRRKTVAELTIDAYDFYPGAKYVGFFDFNNPVVIIRDPELIKTIAIKSFDYFPDHRSFIDGEHDPLFRKALFSLRGDEWRETRTMLSPAFTLSKLKGMLKLMNECGADFTNYIYEMPEDKRTVEMKDVFTRYTNDVIATCAFGISINSMRDRDNDFYVLGGKATNFDTVKTLKFILMRGFPKISKLIKLRLIPDKINNFFENVVKEVIDNRDKNNIVRADMIQLMMEARNKRAEMGQDLPLTDIVCQAFGFFFGGFDTVSTAMCFTCHEIGVNPDIQRKLLREIDEVIERTNGNPTYEVIQNMEYLDAVINESLRRYPIAVFIDRLCTESYELPPSFPGCKPFLLKKDMNVWFPVYGLHHDPKYFEDPYKFDPERFIKRGKEINNSGVYLPFGLGPRICIGNRFALLEMKVLIIHLLARFNLKPCSKTQYPLRLSKKGISMSAENGFWMNFEKRNDIWMTTLTLVAIVLSIYYYIFKDLSYFKKIGIPCIKPWPILGSIGPVLSRQKTMAEVIINAYNLHPKAKYVGFFEFNNPVFVIRDPELIKIIAIKNFDYFTDHQSFFDGKKDLLFGNILLSLRGNQWKEFRTMLTPVYTLSKLKNMFKLINECAKDFTYYLTKFILKNKRTIEMKDVLTRYTNDIIVISAFGISINSMKDRENEIYVFGRRVLKLEGVALLKFFFMRNFPTLTRLFDIKLLSEKNGSFFVNVIKDVVKDRSQNEIVRPDMIQLMMKIRKKKAEIGEDLSLMNLSSQAFGFFIAAFEIVATSICCTCHEIGVNPDVQKKLQREIDMVIDTTNGDLTYDVINNMQYLNAVINESLRRYPFNTFLDRQCIKTYELPPSLPGCKPIRLKKGTNLWFPIYGLHHDPKYFDDPYKFDPERFVKHEKEITNSGVYLPFGLGPRKCIGNRFALLEMKVLIFNLLARCNLKPSNKTQNPIRLSKKQISITAENGFWMDFIERDDVRPAFKKNFLASDNPAYDNTNSYESITRAKGYVQVDERMRSKFYGLFIQACQRSTNPYKFDPFEDSWYAREKKLTIPVSIYLSDCDLEYALAWAMILAFVIVILSIYYYVFKDLSYFKKIGLPYIEPWPVLGNMGPAFLRQKTMADITEDIYNINREAKYVGFFDMGNPIVVIREPELIKMLAVKNFDNFPDHRSFVDEVQDPLFGKNLFSLKGNRWRETRTMLSPAFTLSKLKGMFKLMNECGADFTDYLSKMPKDKRRIEMKDVFTRYTNDVIATCAFGISINSMRDRDNDFYVLGRKATNFDGIKTFKFFLIRSCPTITKLFNIKLIPDTIANFFKNVVEEVINTRDRDKIVRSDVIQLMMEARNKRIEMGQDLPLMDIVAQAFIFFFGGFDSVSTAMCFTCHEIGVNPDIQQRLQREIDDVIEKTNGNPTYEVINAMEYLDAVISESLRRYPIVVFLDRLCVESYELPPSLPGCKPFHLKKGTNIWFPIYGLHHDPQYFEDPYKFNPERFMEHGKEINNSGVYLPFGLGPRMCIGNRFALLEMKVLIFHLLARCNLKPFSKTQNPLQLSKKGISMTAENGFWIDLERREDIHPILKNFSPNTTADDNTTTGIKTESYTNGVANGHTVKA
ncbi:LOW QUALITY PROTEIN: CP9E2 protein [Vespula squamosa]|uniref:CP9E2 protein n=1 Tax=Vespula squamosa TaxID=30214 RepID=A0ABD2B1P6_VESSQ